MPHTVNETQVQTVSANESGQRIMGNKFFDGVIEVWDECPLAKLRGTPARDRDSYQVKVIYQISLIYTNFYTTDLQSCDTPLLRICAQEENYQNEYEKDAHFP